MRKNKMKTNIEQKSFKCILLAIFIFAFNGCAEKDDDPGKGSEYDPVINKDGFYKGILNNGTKNIYGFIYPIDFIFSNFYQPPTSKVDYLGLSSVQTESFESNKLNFDVMYDVYNNERELLVEGDIKAIINSSTNITGTYTENATTKNFELNYQTNANTLFENFVGNWSYRDGDSSLTLNIDSDGFFSWQDDIDKLNICKITNGYLSNTINHHLNSDSNFIDVNVTYDDVCDLDTINGKILLSFYDNYLYVAQISKQGFVLGIYKLTK